MQIAIVTGGNKGIGLGITKELIKNDYKVIVGGRSIYEDKETRESYGWNDEFDFSSWVYDDSQEEIYSQFKYYIERGVSPSFVIETMKARSDDGWFPRRKDLLRANVITK